MLHYISESLKYKIRYVKVKKKKKNFKEKVKSYIKKRPCDIEKLSLE